MEFDPIIFVIAGASLAAGLCVLALASSTGDKDRKAYKNRLTRVAGGKVVGKNEPDAVASIRSNSGSDSGIKFRECPASC